MSKQIQYIFAGLLVVVAGLQIAILQKLNRITPEPAHNKQEEVRIPSIDEIDERISSWTMHFGQHFSSL